jgi:thioredoxin reductase (NADPH)
MKYLEGICAKVYHIHHDDPIPEDTEAVFVAIGRVPGTRFLEGFVELDSDGYVVAGEDCKTSRAHVYAVGDCRTKSVRQLVTAAGDAAVAVGWL